MTAIGCTVPFGTLTVRQTPNSCMTPWPVVYCHGLDSSKQMQVLELLREGFMTVNDTAVLSTLLA